MLVNGCQWYDHGNIWQPWMVSFINNHLHPLAGLNHGNMCLVYVGLMTFYEPIDGLMIDDMKKFSLNINWLMGLIVAHEGLQILHTALSSQFSSCWYIPNHAIAIHCQSPSSDLYTHRETRMVFNFSSRAQRGQVESRCLMPASFNII